MERLFQRAFQMRNHYLAAAATTLIALCATVYPAAKDNPAARPQNEPSPDIRGLPFGSLLVFCDGLIHDS
jgi:hypothetical protein